MPHADSSFVPEDIKTKSEFYAHVENSLKHLIEGERFWVTNLAQTASLLYHSYLASPLYGGTAQQPVVNWTGFYLHPPSYPGSSTSSASLTTTAAATATPSSSSSSSAIVKPKPRPLLLGPYHGRPACLSITPISGRGVCADAFLNESTVVVDDVEAYPGHIACDGDTKSEIVVPLKARLEDGSEKVIGVLDLDSTELGTYDEDDKQGLESIARLLAEMTDFA